jgi:gamma-tubulin complex component 5
LLLELSDQPTQKSKLRDLDLLIEPEEDVEPPLTWDEIAKEDGWKDDDGLWRDIDYATDSSDAGEYSEEISEISATSIGTEEDSTNLHGRTAQDLVIKSDEESPLQAAEKSQAWRYAQPQREANGKLHKTAITDYQLLREVLFLLSGLSTTLFDTKGDPVSNYQLANVSWGSYKALVASFAECGRLLGPLREFCRRKQDVALLQVFGELIERRLWLLDRDISDLQSRFVCMNQDEVVSLVKILPELKPSLAPLYALSEIVQQLDRERYAHPFRYLELLFDATGAAQSEGNEEVYASLGVVFFDCFQVYLRPIRQWMEEGTLLPGDKTFFVSLSSTELPLKQLWNGQFKLLQTQGGVLHAPRFLQPAVKRIFTTGKSVNVLKHLGRHELVRGQRPEEEPALDFASVCSSAPFAPFSELFNQAFNVWIQSKHHTTSVTLREVLFESCGLSTALDALQRIYLCSDSSIADALATPIFQHLDNLSPSWKDRFTLTEMAQEAFSSSVDSRRLTGYVDSKMAMHSGIASRSSVRVSLPAIRLTYRLDWPVQLVLLEDGMSGYQAVFTLLLQVRRGSYVLRKDWTARGGTNSQHGFYRLIRTKLLWFCGTITTYLTTLVIAPRIAALHEDLRRAVDVDDMIAAHANFMDRLIAESCLGVKLNPLRDCMLDVLDWAIKLEDVHSAELARQAEEQAETSRLSDAVSPPRSRANDRPVSKRPTREHDDDEDEERSDGVREMLNSSVTMSGRSYSESLRSIHDGFEKSLRFITGGLRAVARAARDPASVKWDLLAEMLELGIADRQPT